MCRLFERWIRAPPNPRFSPPSSTEPLPICCELNQRPFKKLPLQASAFAHWRRRPSSRCRPPPMALAQFKPARVNIVYHVAFEGHHYSVPHQHVGAAVELRSRPPRWKCCCAASARRPCSQRQAPRLHHGAPAHAGVAPGPLAVDTGQAHRLGRAHRRGHAGVAAVSGGACAPRAGLPPFLGLMRLPQVRRRTPASRLRSRAVHSRAQLPQRQVVSWPAGSIGRTAASAGQQRCAHAGPRQRARARLLRHH